jgi:hypothetical protein
VAGPTIIAKFIADTKELVSGVSKGTDDAGSAVKSFGKKAALAVGGAFAVGKVVEFGKASVDAATADAAAQATLARTLKNVTGATDDQVAQSEKYISSLSKATSIADDDLRPAYDKLVRGFGNAADAKKALALATDVSAGSGKDLSTVTDAMMKAAQGSTGALSKMGVATKDAGGKALTLDQIMGNMSSTFSGQAAEAADTTAGKMEGAKIAYGEFQETLGTAVLPALGAFADILNTSVLPVLQVLATFVAENSGWLAPLAGIILGVVAALKAWAVVQAVLNLVMAANPIVLVVVAIAALVAGIIIAYQKVDWFRTICDTAFRAIATAFGWITDAASAVFSWISEHWPLLLAILTGPIGAAVLLIVGHWDTIKEGATAVWQWIVDKFNAVVDFLRGIAGTIGGIVTSIADAIKAPINAVIRAWNGLEFRVPSVTIPKVSIPGLPDIGGGTIGGQTIGFPNLPLLARGGIITGPTLAMLGEAGHEAVIPLPRRAGDMGSRVYNLNVTVPLGGDPAMAGRAIVNVIRQYERANGVAWRTAS